MIEGALTLEIHLSIARIFELNRISDEFDCTSFDETVCKLIDYYRMGREKQLAWLREENKK